MVDKNEAPEGYEAISDEGMGHVWACEKCAFHFTGCPKISCYPEARKDKEYVYFKKVTNELTLETRLNTLTIGKCIPIDGGLYATKIPQGWIYESMNESGNVSASCFVPETKEVDWEKCHDR